MKNDIREKLEKTLQLHSKWLQGQGAGRADLSGAYLSRANLDSVILSHALLNGADLREANLCGANLNRAALNGADLSWADLRGVELCGTDLRGANLFQANLSELENFNGVVGNRREIKSLQTNRWDVAYTATHMQIGCQLHSLSAWWKFTDDEINQMDMYALDWWHVWKPILQKIIEASPATPYRTKYSEPRS